MSWTPSPACPPCWSNCNEHREPCPGNDLAARFGRDGAHAEWFYGFRLAIRTDPGRRIVRAWSIVPAAVDERQIGADLVTGDAAAIDALLQDKGFHRHQVRRRDGRHRDRGDHPAHPGAAPDHAPRRRSG